MAVEVNANSVTNASTRSPLRFLVAAAVVLLPFNALPYFHGPFGELSVEGAFYPLLICIICIAVSFAMGAKLQMPTHVSAVLLLIFLLWCYVSLVANIPLIAQQTIKGRAGSEKAALQAVLATFVALAAFVTYHIVSADARIFSLVRKAALISAVIAGAYSIFELMYFTGNDTGIRFLEATHPLIRTDDSPALYYGRIRSVSGEASWFAMYCGFVGPWLFGGMRQKGIRGLFYMLLVAYFLVLVGLTWSRTALAIVSMQVLVFFVMLATERGRANGRSLLKFAAVIAIVIAVVALVAQSGLSKFGVGTTGAVSAIANRESLQNQGRFGSQVAAIKMAADHPLFGVGLGQYGFHMSQYVPLWASTSFEVQAWMSFAPGTSWAPVQGIYPRIAAETGLIGLVLWLSIWASLGWSCVQRFRERTRAAGAPDADGLAVLLCMAGVLLSGFNADSFRFFGYWLVLAFAWYYVHRAEPGDHAEAIA